MQRAIRVLLCITAPALWATELESINSAERCGSCHRSIYEAWESSAHADAMESRLFQDSLELVEADFGKNAQRACLGCHAPLAIQTGDLGLKLKSSWEGVSCDYCHSMRKVETDRPNPEAVMEYSLVKSGPLKDAMAGVHETVYSDVHTSSALCAPCHQYRNSLGLDVLTTYKEWEESRYARENIPCQSCHMGTGEGAVVEPRIKRSSRKLVDLHEMPGGHSLKQLTKAIRARLTTRRQGGNLEVSVEVANVGAGHYVPTGSPVRKLVLEVNATAHNGETFSQKWIYRRTVTDKEGNPLSREHKAFFLGAKVVSDTRLAPDEKRTEKFSLPVPPGVSAQVRAVLSYYYSPTARSDTQERLVFLNLSEFVR